MLAVLAAAAAATVAGPRVTYYPSYNQALNVLVPGGVSAGGTVKWLGSFGGDNGTTAAGARGGGCGWRGVLMASAPGSRADADASPTLDVRATRGDTRDAAAHAYNQHQH